MKKIFLSSFAPKEIVLSLEKYGFEVRLLPPSQKMKTETSAHADMLMFKHEETLILSKYYFDSNKALFDGVNGILSDEYHGEKYPEDILYNCFVYQNKCFGKISHISKAIISYCKNNEIEVKMLKQGYAKCSCIVTPMCLITADVGVYKEVNRQCTECYLIKNDIITLPGYDTGFVGGASFYDDGRVYFFGDYHTHSNGEKIEKILLENKIEPISLGSNKLYDLGGGIII